MLLESYPVLAKQQGANSPGVRQLRERIFTLFEASGQPAKAAAF